MISYRIENTEKAERLVSLCRQFTEDIDVIYGRQIIDGKSILGVISLVGDIVSLEVITDSQRVRDTFMSKVENLEV